MPRGEQDSGLEEVLMTPSVTRPASPERVAAAELPDAQRYASGVGHMFNDLSATCWLSYLLVYLQSVANLSNVAAGAWHHCVHGPRSPPCSALAQRP